MHRPILLAFAAIAVLGCMPAGETARPRAGGDCATLFRHYDRVESTISETRRDRWAVPPELGIQAGRLRRAGCITLTRDLRLETAAPVAVAGDGAAIAPVALHAGVVTSMADDAVALAFFEAAGMRARSVGDPALGRRVHLGPFATEGGLAAAADLARTAGFAHPYPRRF